MRSYGAVSWVAGVVVALALLSPRVAAAAPVSADELQRAAQQTPITQYLTSQSATFGGDYISTDSSGRDYSNAWVVQFTGDVTEQEQVLHKLFQYPDKLKVVSVRYSLQALEHVMQLVEDAEGNLAAQGVQISYLAPDLRLDSVVVHGIGAASEGRVVFGRMFPGQPLDVELSGTRQPDQVIVPTRLSNPGSGSGTARGVWVFALMAVAVCSAVWVALRIRNNARARRS